MRGGLTPSSTLAILILAAALPLACKHRDGEDDAGVSDLALADAWGTLDTPELIDGTSPSGVAVNAPSDWTAQAGAWNAKFASYCPANDKIVFSTTRADLVGGSIYSSQITAAGVMVYFQGGPHTGTLAPDGTSVLYVATADGSEPTCIGCSDVTDGVGGVEIDRVAPSSTAQPAAIVRQPGATIYANLNKDLARWTPDGKWLIAGIEMPTHASAHTLGCSDIGMFNDLWAISSDGKTWVQLTQYAQGWTYGDPIAPMPYQCSDAHCPTGCQYGAGAPFGAYSCSAPGARPPASGTMRPIVSSSATGPVHVIWSERVGLTIDPAKPKYTWAGVQQLAAADLAMNGGRPALVSYRENLTPTPASPAGVGLWSNPGGATVIGAGYESWGFSDDDATFYFASDAFLSTSNPAVHQPVSPISEAFTDAIAWTWNAASPTLTDITRYDATVYAYAPNAAPQPIGSYGHWEEPIVPAHGTPSPFYAFASSANLDPAWDPSGDAGTFGLEVWLMRADRSKPAIKLTHFNEPATAPRVNVVATAQVPSDQSLYVSVEPEAVGASNPPGALYRLRPSPP